MVALGLLIFYHVTLVYAPWDWHVQSAHTFEWLGKATLATSPWRLTLLFLVSGAAVRLMSRKFSAGEVLRQRIARLVPPLLFGIVVLVPPQSWLEAVDKGWYDGGLLAWWIKEFSFSGIAGGLAVNHLWFVVYIAAYTLAAVALLFRPALLAAIQDRLEKTLTGWRMLVIPIAYLAFMRWLLFPWFGVTNNIGWDWYNHSVSLAVFVFGFAVAGSATIWATLERLRWVSLAVAAAALPVLIFLYLNLSTTHPGSALRYTVFAIDQWATIAAILGFSSKHIRHADGPVLRYLTQAVFPCYMAHQTLLVAAAFWIKPKGIAAPIEAAILIAVTFAGSLAVYEVVRRIDVIRPIWGLKREPKAALATPRKPLAEAA